MLINLAFIKQAYAADEGFNLGDSLVIADGKKVSDVYNDPSDIVNLIVNNLMIIAGVVIFFMIMIAGFKMLSDTEKGKEEAKEIIKACLIGLILMFCAYWFVQIVGLISGTNVGL